MRIRSSGPVRTPPPLRPTRLQRGIFFVLGALLGGLLGYGYRTSGPGPNPAFLSLDAAPWILVPGAVLGVVGALFPDATFFKPGGRFRWYHDEDN
jgi:hypothetical protein